MSEMPDVKPRDWIRLGTTDAVVCNVRSDEFKDVGGDIEAVYLDYRNRAINVNLNWTGEGWAHAGDGVDGGYADNYQRLREYVHILRRGRYR